VFTNATASAFKMLPWVRSIMILFLFSNTSWGGR
jgi:hypothetical protein